MLHWLPPTTSCIAGTTPKQRSCPPPPPCTHTPSPHPLSPLPTLQGSKKTKLGLREFVKLGAFTQTIDVDNSMAVRASRPCGQLRALSRTRTRLPAHSRRHSAGMPAGSTPPSVRELAHAHMPPPAPLPRPQLPCTSYNPTPRPIPAWLSTTGRHPASPSTSQRSLNCCLPPVRRRPTRWSSL
jgi:hypothetical protein